MSQTNTAVEHLDVVVIGAGLSGVGAGYRLQTECPTKSYAILEARAAIGGTWDLFRYPGVRSDSDMFTLGYPFEPWRDAKAIADGPSILKYVRHTAAKHGIDQRIRFDTQVVAADWSTAEARWTLTLEHRGSNSSDTDGGPSTSTLTCSFLYSCAGYYDYSQPHDPLLPGLSDFTGQVVHPQFWPETLDYAGKRVVVIGSGATAVTLVPAMTADGGGDGHDGAAGSGPAAHVTMLQRTPTWISPVPAKDKIADRIRATLPAGLAHRIVRSKNILFTLGVYQFCQRRPEQARAFLLKTVRRQVGEEHWDAADYTPPYAPWDQRLCAVPDGDFFRAVRKGQAEVVTDHIETFTADGIRLTSGRELPADIVVTATGLKLQLFGGVTPSVDGVPVPLNEQFVWQGAMLTGLPNLALCVGYTNASWTLRADLSSRLVCKVLNHLDEHDLASVVPVPDADLAERPLLNLSAGYVQRALPHLPKQGDRGVWQVRQNYLLDAATTMRTDLSKTLEGRPRAEMLTSSDH